MNHNKTTEEVGRSCLKHYCEMLLLFFLISVTIAKSFQLENVHLNKNIASNFQDPADNLTTSAGAPIEYADTEVISSNLISNHFFLESITRFTRERIPERVVHAKGAGAFGYFIVTHNVTDICKAELFSSIGKKTPVAIRFSTVAGEKGSSDNVRETKGFAVKFYTEEGNFDIVGLNIEMFVIKDPVLFPFFIHSIKRNPRTNLMDSNTMWDFITLHPETLHMFLRIFGDRGISDGYRYMPGYGIHTIQITNNNDEDFFVKFHILPDAGIRNLTSEQSIKINDLDYATRDLYNAIANREYPTWTLYVQVASLHDVKHATFDLFDITKRWPIEMYPLRPIGQIVLNKNPLNYFADIEQLAFCPSNLVAGILGGVDKLFEARRLAYRDAQLYRLGANYNNIEVNCPFRNHANTYHRDGAAPVRDNGKDAPNYYPNSFNGPMPYLDKKKSTLLKIRTDPNANNFDQASELYTNGMATEERSRLIKNIVNNLNNTARYLQERAVKLFTIIHPDFGGRVALELRKNNN